jgi:hypothetical protein
MLEIGRFAIRRSSLAVSLTFSASVIARDTRSWMSNTSSSVPLNFSDQTWASVDESTSWALMRRLFPARRTLPSST